MNCYRTAPIARICVAFVGLLFWGTAFSPFAHAQVRDWSIARARGFDQTANNTAPTTPVNYAAFGQVATEGSGGPDQFTTVTLEGSPSGSIPFFGVDFGGGVADWEFESSFPTLAGLDAVLPNGTYTIEATGSLGTFSESITLAGDFSTNIPFFNNDTFDHLQNFDTTQAVTLSWNTSPTDGFFLSIQDLNTFEEPFFIEGFRNANSGQTSADLPTGTLKPGHTYSVNLEFPVVTTEDVRDSFLTGEGLSGYVNSTQFTFTTIPEPASVLLLLCGTVLLIGSRSRRSRLT